MIKEKSKVKGFTLVEMIIVMALFSIIMYSVVQLLNPISKFFVRSSNYEESTSCIDNIKRAIEGNLKYADRVRVYYNYRPETTGELGDADTANLVASVQEFYNMYFDNRALTDIRGKIYVMFFDNKPKVTPPISQLHEYNDNQLNRGQIDFYTFDFHANDPADLLNVADESHILKDWNVKVEDGGKKQEWYVNQKLYGNFDFSYTLGAREMNVQSPLIDSPDDNAVVDPENFTINIHAEEVSLDKETTGLVKRDYAGKTVASFAMKNVLESTIGSQTIAKDIVTYLKGAATRETAGVKDFRTQPVLRFTRCDQMTFDPSDENHNEDNASFYFVFTVPETVHDDSTSAYPNL